VEADASFHAWCGRSGRVVPAQWRGSPSDVVCVSVEKGGRGYSSRCSIRFFETLASVISSGIQSGLSSGASSFHAHPS
jgi:hypothetical protein